MRCPYAGEREFQGYPPRRSLVTATHRIPECMRSSSKCLHLIAGLRQVIDRTTREQ
jgi:hypothetical protein